MENNLHNSYLFQALDSYPYELEQTLEALNYALSQFDPLSGAEEPTFDNVDNDLQTYYTIGLTYKF